MDKIQLQKLRDLPIEGVAERLGLRVNKHKSLCPFHDDHAPSCSYSVSKNSFRCFVCGAHGGTIDLVMKKQGADFKEACRWLADENNIILEEWKPVTEKAMKANAFDPQRYERFFVRPWLSEEARRFLFEERKLDERVVRWCRITSWRDKQGVNWLQTPYFDMDGNLIGVQNRNLDIRKNDNDAPKGVPRFRFPYGSRCSIYNLPVLKMLKPGDELWITEGCSDCWAMLSAGHKAIAIPSATLLMPKDKELLVSLSLRLCSGQAPSSSLTFHMYPDHDLPGEQLFLQLKEILPHLIHHDLPLGYKDFGEWYAKTR